MRTSTPFRSGSRSLVGFFVLAALTTPFGIGCQFQEWEETHLNENLTAVEVLTESTGISRSRADDRNRWVSGWRFFKEDGRVLTLPTSVEASIEMVLVESRARTLRFLLPDGGSDAAGSVAVVANDREVGLLDLKHGATIDIPPGDVEGVLPVKFRFSDPGMVKLVGLETAEPREPGTIKLVENGILQTGWSIVRWTHLVEDSAVIEGGFNPPKRPVHGQCFFARTSLQNRETQQVFKWCADDHRQESEIRFRQSIRGYDGVVQLQLIAHGEGGPGRWNLRIKTPSKSNSRPPESPLPPAPKVVVLYVMDALRADAVSFSETDPRDTPCLASLSTEGVVFKHHFSVAPSTGPSTKSLFLGLPYQHGKGIPDGLGPTLAETFSTAGYRTGSFSSNPVLSSEFGIVAGFDEVGFFELKQDHRLGARSVNDSAQRVHDGAWEWIRNLDPDDRVFLYFHTLHPHNPYTPPAEILGSYVDLTSDLPVGTTRELVEIRDGGIDPDEETRARIKAAYAASVAYNDGFLAGLVDALETRYGKDEVLLVVTSDHGEELFDHGGVLHGYTLFDEMLHVPLMFRWPGVLGDGVVDVGTGTLDVHSTLRRLVEREGFSSTVAGSSLWPVLLGEEDCDSFSSRPVFAHAPALADTPVMARTNLVKLVETQSKGVHSGLGFHRGQSYDSEYVFDISKDPHERHNIGASDNLQLDWLRTQLRAWEARWKEASGKVEEPQADHTTKERLRALGYVVD